MFKNSIMKNNIILKNLKIMDYLIILFFLSTIFLYISDDLFFTKIVGAFYPFLALYILGNFFYFYMSTLLVPLNASPVTKTIAITIFLFPTYHSIRSYINAATGLNPDFFPNTILAQQGIFIIEIIALCVLFSITLNIIYIMYKMNQESFFTSIIKIIILSFLLTGVYYSYYMVSNKYNSQAGVVVSLYLFDSYLINDCSFEEESDLYKYQKEYNKTIINIQEKGLYISPEMVGHRVFRVEDKNLFALYEKDKISFKEINCSTGL